MWRREKNYGSLRSTAAARWRYQFLMRRCAIVLVLVAFVFSSGGEWSLAQCVAWANMIREYSQTESLGEAMQMTFSGEHPCAMCKAIAEKKQHDNGKAFVIAKPEKPLFSPAFALKPRELAGTPTFYVSRETFLRTRAEAPPTPPPRWA
jgi:hypothetical protein